MRPPALPALPALVAGAGAYVALLSDLTPGLHWHDTAEWAGAGRALALAHPPGHPVALLSIHAAQLLPWLDAAGRAALASALWTALGAAAVADLAWSLLAARRGAPSTAPSAALSAAVAATLAGWLYCALPLVWQQGTRAEVYAAQGALAAVALALWARHLRDGDARPLYGAALALGLSGANHTLLAAAVALPALGWGAARRLSARLWAGLGACALAGLAPYALLPLRGRAGGPVGWGWVDSWASFVDTVLARVWQRQVAARFEEVDWGGNVARLVAFLWAQVGAGVGLLAVTALALAAARWARARDEEAGAALTLAGVCLSVGLTQVAYPFLTVNPDFSGYLAAGAAAGVALLALAAARLHPLAAPLLLAALLAGAARAPRPHGGAGAHGAEAWARALSEEVPAGGALWAAHYSTHFLLTGLWATEGWRGDVGYVFRGYRAEPWAAARLARPEAEGLGWRHPLSGARPEEDPRARFEVSGPLDPLPALAARARAVGLTWALSPAGVPASLAALRARWAAGAAGAGRLDVDTCYAWALYHEAHAAWLSAGGALEALGEGGGRLGRAALLEAHQGARDEWLGRLAEE